MDHTQACPYCPKMVRLRDPQGYQLDRYVCSVYIDERSWINRRGGCPQFPLRTLPPGLEYVDGEIMTTKQRKGQQKQKRVDRKYDNAKSKRKFGQRSID
jgi:hypothetical protein